MMPRCKIWHTRVWFIYDIISVCFLSNFFCLVVRSSLFLPFGLFYFTVVFSSLLVFLKVCLYFWPGTHNRIHLCVTLHIFHRTAEMRRHVNSHQRCCDCLGWLFSVDAFELWAIICAFLGPCFWHNRTKNNRKESCCFPPKLKKVENPFSLYLSIACAVIQFLSFNFNTQMTLVRDSKNIRQILRTIWEGETDTVPWKYIIVIDFYFCFAPTSVCECVPMTNVRHTKKQSPKRLLLGFSPRFFSFRFFVCLYFRFALQNG